MLKIPTRFKIRVNADNIERVLDILRCYGYEWISGRKLELRGDFQYTTVGLLIDQHNVARYSSDADYQACSFNEMSIFAIICVSKNR